MRRRWVLMIIGANLLALIALMFIYPQFMIAPGPLKPAHADLGGDCFACHAAGRGATPDRCLGCHKLPDIGLRTTQGIAIAGAGMKLSFHQQLTETRCMACHSEHADPKLTHTDLERFSHALLKPEIRDRCSTCHVPPDNELHRDIKTNCSQCHQPEHWKPARFDHTKWFLLEGEHDAKCTTCHVGSDFSRYTCFGCHEHQPDRIRAKHLKEGIRDFDDCVECHRSADDVEEGHGREREERD